MAAAPVVAATAAPEAIAPEAFDVERDAQQRLSTAHAKIGHVLDNANSPSRS